MVATVSVVALTIYCLIALPGVKELSLSLVRLAIDVDAFGSLTDEVFDGSAASFFGPVDIGHGRRQTSLPLACHLQRSLCAALGPGGSNISISYRWSGRRSPASSFPWSHARKVSPLEFQPLASTFVLPLPRSSPQPPRVVKHAVKVTPGLTIIATLIGASLLGIIGALIAIPIAETIHLLLQEIAVPRQNQR